MAVVNSDVEPGEQPVVQSRYSIVLATAKRARQLISGHEPLVRAKGKEIKPLSVAVEELYNAKIKILNEDDTEEEEPKVTVLEETDEEAAKDSGEGPEKLSEDNENESEEPSKKDDGNSSREPSDENDNTEALKEDSAAGEDADGGAVKAEE